MPRKGRKVNDMASLWLPSRRVAKELGTTSKTLRDMINFELIQEGEHYFRGANKFRNFLYHIGNLKRDWGSLKWRLRDAQTLGAAKVTRNREESRNYSKPTNDIDGYPVNTGKMPEKRPRAHRPARRFTQNTPDNVDIAPDGKKK